MRALITGGAGFIGSYLAEVLLEQEWEVAIIDDLSTGSIDNIISIKNNERFKYVLDTVMNRPVTAELVDWSDIVFHLAAAVGVRMIIDSPVKTIETNIKATEQVLELASKKSKVVLVASTSEVYGKLDRDKFCESDDLILGPTSKARWSYAASKIVDEFLMASYCKEKNLPALAVRLFNAIGPRQTGRYGMVVPTFVGQAMLGEPITVYGDGAQRRSFTWVYDVVNALITLAQDPRAYGEVFNIGHTKEISIYELAVLVKQIAESDSDVIFVPYEHAYGAGFEDMKRRLPDLTKIHKLIGYLPSVDLPEMLKNIVDDLKKEGKITR